MPRHQKAMKDAVTCDKRRQGGSSLWPDDFRMGQPTASHVAVLVDEFIVDDEQTGRSETSQYPQEEKTKVISLVAASEKEIA